MKEVNIFKQHGAWVSRHTVDEEVFELYQHIVSAQQLEDKFILPDILKIFRKACNPRLNIVFEQHQFLPHHVVTNGTDTYTAKRRQKEQQQQSEITENDMLRDKIVFHMTDKRLGERLLREMDLCLQKGNRHLPGLGSHALLEAIMSGQSIEKSV